jgi:hypothetical protein
MKAKPSRGVPALFHAAVAFAVFFSVMSSPLGKGSYNLGGFRSNLHKVDASVTRDSKLGEARGGKQGHKLLIAELDPTVPPPPPPPPPR